MTETENMEMPLKQVGFNITLFQWIDGITGEMWALSQTHRGPHPYLDNMFDFTAAVSDAALHGRNEVLAKLAPIAREFENNAEKLTATRGPYTYENMEYATARNWWRAILRFLIESGLTMPGQRESDTFIKDHFEEVERELSK